MRTHILVRNNTIDKGYIQIQAEGSQDQNLTAGQHQGVFVAVENNTLKAHTDSKIEMNIYNYNLPRDSVKLRILGE